MIAINNNIGSTPCPVAKAESPLFTFFAISDLHCTANVDATPNINLKNALLSLNQIDPNAALLCIVGDLTESGLEEEYATLMQTMRFLPHAKACFTIGNHDLRWQKGGFEEAYERFVRNTKMPHTYYDVWVCNHHFIFLASDEARKDEAFLSDIQLNWLQEKLKENATVGTPKFVFLHQALPSTCAGSFPTHGYGTSGYADGVVPDTALIKILEQHSPILITGHTHASLAHVNTVANMGRFICANTGSIYYTIACDGFGTPRESEGLYFAVYKDKIIIRGRSFTNNKWIENARWEIALPFE